MSTITTINSTDLITNSRADINTNFANLNSDKIETSVIDTDTTLAADSDAKIPSQKAVKAYIDNTGNANASTTAKGMVEIATAAEIDAGTGTGATGAVLALSPDNVNSAHNIPFVAPGTSGNVMTSDGTDWTSSTPSLPVFQQFISIYNLNNTTFFASGSNTDGSVMYVFCGNSGGNELFRYERDSVTGMYFLTHNVNSTLTFGTGDSGGIIQIGSYIYVFSNDATNIICKRYLAADLTGEQAMTVPTVTCNSTLVVWTDGTNAYLISSSSATTSRLWTLSGTTFSAGATATVTTGYQTLWTSSVWDGTNAYIASYNASNVTFTIRKLNAIDATTITSTTTKSLYPFSDADFGAVMVPAGTGKLYIGGASVFYDESATIKGRINLVPVTKP